MKTENPLIGFDLFNLKGTKVQKHLYRKMMEEIRRKIEDGLDFEEFEESEKKLLNLEEKMQIADAMASAGGLITKAVITNKGLQVKRIN